MRVASCFSTLCLSIAAFGQRFEVVTVTPPSGGSKASVTKGLVGPLVAEGTGTVAKQTSTPGIIEASRKLTRGFSTKTVVTFAEDPNGKAVLFDIPNISGGEPSPGVVYHSAKEFLSRSGTELTAEDSPMGFDLYDNPVVRFVMLGTPLPGSDGRTSGSVTFRSSETMVRRVEWQQDQEGWIHLKSMIEKAPGQSVTSLLASVRTDRSMGSLTRFGNEGVPPVKSLFKRISTEPVMFDYAHAFPRGLNTLDYRGGRLDPDRHPWGVEDSNVPSVQSKPASPRGYGLFGGILLLCGGIGSAYLSRKVKKERLPSS